MIKLFWHLVLLFHYSIVFVKYIVKMTYEWAVLIVLMCIAHNAFYPASPFRDYIWIAPIASLMILLAIEAFNEPT